MIELVLSILSTALSTIALYVALVKLNARWPRRRFDELEIEVGDIAHQINSLAASHKRLNSRVGMREARAKAAEGRTESAEASGEGIGTAATRQRPGETPEEWKARMRLLLKTGALNG